MKNKSNQNLANLKLVLPVALIFLVLGMGNRELLSLPAQNQQDVARVTHNDKDANPPPPPPKNKDTKSKSSPSVKTKTDGEKDANLTPPSSDPKQKSNSIKK